MPVLVPVLSKRIEIDFVLYYIKSNKTSMMISDRIPAPSTSSNGIMLSIRTKYS